jgi:aspartyl-tRNA(Asn)/glutamyl-tRNA(Gln) amidotransferase subunit C
MEVTAQTVLDLCDLAKLELEPAELEQMQRDLARILAYVEQLGEVDTRGVEATTHALVLGARMRPDVVSGVLPADLALRNAPQRSASALVVPQVKDE